MIPWVFDIRSRIALTMPSISSLSRRLLYEEGQQQNLMLFENKTLANYVYIMEILSRFQEKEEKYAIKICLCSGVAMVVMYSRGVFARMVK